MTPAASHCLGCGAGYFPARLRCHRCGGMAFEPRPVEQVRVAAVTRVHRVPAGCTAPYLVELEAAGGFRLLAAAAFPPAVGNPVRPIQRDDGAVVIEPPPKEDSHE